MNDRNTAEDDAPPPGSQLEYKAILANASIGIAFTRDRKFTLCSAKFAEMFGWPAEELIGQPGDVLYPSRESYEAMGAIAMPVLSARRQLDIEWQVRRRDGSIFLARLIAEAVSPNNAQERTVWFVEDITVRKGHADDVARLLLEQDAILNTAPIGICFVKDWRVVRCTRRFEQMHGYAPGELDGQPTSLLYADEAANQAIGEPFGAEASARRKDGTTCWSRISGRAVDRTDPALGSVWMAEDITLERAARESLEASRDALERAVAERTAELRSANERLQAEITDRRQAERRAQHLADHDPLTGLPNRRLLEDRLTQALALSQRNRKQTAVMFVDLDRFKSINDSLGHAAGDLVLKEVSERLVNQLRTVDTICRMGGDEFVVVLPEIKRSSDAANVAAKILETVAQPFIIENRELRITPSVGISVFPDDGRDAGTLIRNADAAMYHAKETGRANYQFFTEQMNQSASKRLALENDLRQAVLNHEMRVHYQPVVDAASGQVAAHEALLRWQHSTRGVIEPAEFIHLAEDSGLVLQLDEWILGEACRWAGAAGAQLVSVNLSARQFNDLKLAELVARVLKSTGLAPRRLELDIAESTAMQQPDFALAVLKKLKGLGIRIALDDFGIGLSGVAHLSRVPVDRIKIDRSLIAGAPRDTERHPVVPAIVGLGHALGLKVVAKGIETEAQKAVLISCGCDYLQGFLIGRPVDADTASKVYVQEQGNRGSPVTPS